MMSRSEITLEAERKRQELLTLVHLAVGNNLESRSCKSLGGGLSDSKSATHLSSNPHVEHVSTKSV
jgi:hypothetical protein